MKNFCTYEEASSWAQQHNVANAKHWLSARKTCVDLKLPVNPDQVYPDFKQRGGWGAFLNTGRTAHKDYMWLPYSEASQWMKDNNILTPHDLHSHPNRPKNIPSSPHKVYKAEFAENGGWSAYVGKVVLNNTSVIERLIRLVLDTVFDPTAHPHRKQVVEGQSGARHQVDMAYPSCRLIVEYDGAYFHANKNDVDQRKTSDLKSANWQVVRIRERGLEKIDGMWDVVVSPGSANQKIQTVVAHLSALCHAGVLLLSAHKHKKLEEMAQRVEIGLLLEKMALYQGFASYEAASQWAVEQGITTAKQWFNQANRPENMPSSPAQTYPDFLERGGWGAFLKTQRVSNRQRKFVNYLEASQWAQDNSIATQKQWNGCAAIRPENIPSNPNQMYPEEFQKYGWRGFVDPALRNPNEDWATYEECRQWAQDNNILSKTAWMKIKHPPNMPAVPDGFYKEFEQNGGWDGFCANQPSVHMKRRK